MTKEEAVSALIEVVAMDMRAQATTLGRSRLRGQALAVLLDFDREAFERMAKRDGYNIPPVDDYDKAILRGFNHEVKQKGGT